MDTEAMIQRGRRYLAEHSWATDADLRTYLWEQFAADEAALSPAAVPPQDPGCLAVVLPVLWVRSLFVPNRVRLFDEAADAAIRALRRERPSGPGGTSFTPG